MENTILGSILAVFSGIAEWFVEIIPVVISLFYTTVEGVGSLTFLGYLAIIGLGISVIFLMLGVISNFLHFRG